MLKPLGAFNVARSLQALGVPLLIEFPTNASGNAAGDQDMECQGSAFTLAQSWQLWPFGT